MLHICYHWLSLVLYGDIPAAAAGDRRQGRTEDTQCCSGGQHDHDLSCAHWFLFFNIYVLLTCSYNLEKKLLSLECKFTRVY